MFTIKNILVTIPIMALCIAAFTGGRYWEREVICGDLHFYFKQDSTNKNDNLVNLRSCE